MKTYLSLVCALALAGVSACGPSDTIVDTEDGQYGSSSGPNPNLSDLQTDGPEGGSTGPADPASPAENTYPSQMGDSPRSTGAEGGRSSAQTGASDE
ncbi:hypothetical protein [Terricaulis sp.]|uniref:hypothetical protein n=1 Tax=Terricaulis sp. TaxID=2768686 RepID=UPI002AC6CE58|nr:hypothetical protein [Terricaulis sp.]MDZ4690285.1 hypothetical protein [Terricaulis sp.]